ncbi:MAG TPA: GntR family transcriptional regulator [Steroidobacteraceae bacterium]|nr:GntR family transcriptional regulator [Steroidobacteraceae bacterium]
MSSKRPKAPPPLAPAAPLHSDVHDELSRRFISGKVTPGSALSTRRLAEEMGVSQTPVREALSRLAAEGAVQIRSKRKIVVPTMTEERFKELLRCRELLEPEAAVRALPYIDARRLSRLKRVDDAIGDAIIHGDLNAYMQGNFDFHFLIYDAQPRGILNRLIEILWLQFGPYMRVVYGRVGTANLVDQHERAIRAIAARDAGKLHRALLADIRDGMGLIGGSGFGREPRRIGRGRPFVYPDPEIL